MTPNHSSSDADHTTVRVTIATATLLMEGDLYLPKTGKDDRRLTALLNSERRFLALTDVMVYDRATNTRVQEKHPFLEVNLNSIEFVKPHQ